MELKVIGLVNSDKYTPLIRADIAPVVSAGVPVDIESLDKGVASIAIGRYIAVMDPNGCDISFLQLLVSEPQGKAVYH